MRTVIILFGLGLGCGSPPEAPHEEPAPQPAPAAVASPADAKARLSKMKRRTRPPGTGMERGNVVPTKVNHRGFLGRALLVDGVYRGEIPVDVMLTVGEHTFEILVGPGDEMRFTHEATPRPGIAYLDLSTLEP